jgi:hypothetical protein
VFEPDAVAVVEGGGGGRVVVVESQLRKPNPQKLRAWPAYVSIGHSVYLFEAAIVVLVRSAKMAQMCRQPYSPGPPGMVLQPDSIGPKTTVDARHPRYEFA